MDKQILAVLFSFILYILYVLLPMIPATVIYRMFPDTKVSATGVLSNLNFKTTGAFAAYVITVVLGYFLVQNTHHLIADISNPVWTLKTKVKLLNPDKSKYIESKYSGGKLIETLLVRIKPEIHSINGETVLLKLPGTKSSWETTLLKFEIPNFGDTSVYMSELGEDANIDYYNLMIKREKPIEIIANPQMKKEYNSSKSVLIPSNSGGPKLSTGG